MPKVAQLVWGKADEFIAELENLTLSTTWTTELVMLPDFLQKKIAEAIQSLTLQHKADFTRRICMSIVERDPFRLNTPSKSKPEPYQNQDHTLTSE